jgi:hypothetical protein
MHDDKAPLYLWLVAAAVLATAVLTLQPYSAEPVGKGFGKPAERFVRAALAQDSVALARLSATDRPVTWALAVARRAPGSLAAWAHHTQAWTGERRGDTTQVFLYSRAALCDDAPIQFRFVGARSGAKVVGASSACLDSAPNARGSGPRP